MDGPVCADGRYHLPHQGSIKVYKDESQSAVCKKCRHPIRRFWVDDDDDRRGGWSTWTALRYVIEELTL